MDYPNRVARIDGTVRTMNLRQIPSRPQQAVAYRPLSSQRKFHCAIRTTFKGFSGPIGSGKSQAMAYETIACAALNPSCVGLVGAPTFPMLRDATHRALFDVLETHRIDYAFNHSRTMP